MKKFFTRFRYPLLASVLVMAITTIYLNVLYTVSSTDRIYISTSTVKTRLIDPNATLLSNIQANLDRMYINNNLYFINRQDYYQDNDEFHNRIRGVIQNPFFRTGIENTLYWQVFYQRASWLDNYCIDRFLNCGPTKYCSCLHDSRVIAQMTWDYYHLFNANDLYTYKTLSIAGCTGAARVFMDLAQKFPLNAATRYVATVKFEDNKGDPDVYSHACPQQNVPWTNYNIKMNGHQVVAIQMANGYWRLLNTSSPQISWARDPSTDTIVETSLTNLVSTSTKRVDVFFPGMPADAPVESYTVASVDVDDVTTHNRLMNKYVSGNVSDPNCRWPAW
ncbi:MAG: hypothetical protein HYV97_01115 [Bdellovibrio sp.]|nr:hypothetical protein [Bdellovibrio sp.]